MCWSFQGFFGTWKVGATGEEEAAEENLSWETRIWVMVLGIVKDELGLVKVGLALLVFVASSFRSGKQGLDDYKILPVFSSRLVCLHCSDFRSQEPISGNHFPVLQILIFVHFYCTLSLPMGQIPEEARPQSHCCSSGAIADEGETGSAWKPGQSEKFIGSPNSHSKDRICVVRMEQDAHWRFNAAFLSAPIRETFSRMRVLAANQVALGFFLSLLYAIRRTYSIFWLLDFENSNRLLFHAVERGGGFDGVFNSQESSGPLLLFIRDAYLRVFPPLRGFGDWRWEGMIFFVWVDATLDHNVC